MNILLARLQLRRNRPLALGGIAAIAASMLLIISLDAVLQGMEQRLVAFLRSTGAEVIVAQQGVKTMHMTESAIPSSTASEIAKVDGVERAIPGLYLATSVGTRSGSGLVYLIGYPTKGPKLLALDSGAPPGPGQIVLDADLARAIDAGIGDRVSALGQDLQVSGMVDGTYSAASSTALMRVEELTAALGIEDTISYVFVWAEPGVDAPDLARRIARRTEGISAIPIDTFVESEQRVISDMLTGVVRAITLTGLVIGLAITMLVSRTLVVRQSRDIAVLRAIGLSGRAAAGMVLGQAVIVLLAAAVLATILVVLLVAVLPALTNAVPARLEPVRVLRLEALAAVAVLLGAGWPTLRTLNIDPAKAFRS